ncbi:MAG: pyridoxal-phosphate dependent enzyme, partial [Actinomycetes bacterium]
ASFEVIDRLGDAPDIHVLPVGNAGNITAYWKGYVEYKNDSISSKLPQMWGFQAAGASPIVDGKIVEKPETLATAIRIGNPASWQQALTAKEESKGRIDKVTDEQILNSYHLLAEKEGVFVEPSSAAGVAGLLMLKEKNELPKDKVIVITVTGNGLKDPHWALEGAKDPIKVSVDAKSAAKALGF